MAVIDFPSPAAASKIARVRGSLAAQTAALMLLCLIAAQWMSIWAFCDERARALRAASIEMAGRELVLRADASPEVVPDWAGLTVWRSAARPTLLSDVPGDPSPRPGPRPLAAWAAGDSLPLDWTSGVNGVATTEIGFNWAVLSMPVPGGHLNALLAQPDWTDPWFQQNWSMLALTSAGLILAALLIARRVTAPMQALARAADDFRGAAATPVAETGPGELGRTLAAFNAMQARIAALVGERTRMLSALGHDLRTPMTRLRLRAHLIEDDGIREPTLRDLGEIEALTERALDLARGVAATGARVEVDLAEFARVLRDDLVETGMSLALGRLDNVRITAHPNALRRAVTNLAENAGRYGGGGTLSVETGPGSNGVAARLVVTDRGPGIPDDRLADVVAPFVRLERSRGRDTGGSGLGLSLAAAVAREHGGRLDLSNRPGGGLRAALVLPWEPPVGAPPPD